MRVRIRPVAIFAPCLGFGLFLCGEEPAATDAAAQDPFHRCPQHAMLQRLAGTWDAILILKDEKGAEVRTRGTLTTVQLAGFHTIDSFEGELLGGKMSGHGMSGYCAARKQFFRFWTDSMTGTPMTLHGDFAAAEDAVQEALLAAVLDWRRAGTPENPGGWLYRVACRRLIDELERDNARRRREAVAAGRASLEGRRAPEPQGEDPMAEDDTLILFFLCCHPALTPPSAIALTLRAVGGLATAEIASAYLVPEATMAQRISRAKQTIRASGMPFELPAGADFTQLSSAVRQVLYLIFNEGYTASVGPRLVRVELSAEAIRLARLLHRLQPDDVETAGLLALMLLTDARRAARTGPQGELIPLDEQDRMRWDRAAIDEGTRLVEAALSRGSAGSYQIQAAIAALHDEASSTEATDWPQVLALYGLLERMTDNPMVALNRAVAAAMVHGPAAGLELVKALEADDRIAGHYRLDAVRAHLLERSGDPEGAARNYRAAARRTASLPERHYLLAKAARLCPGDDGDQRARADGS